MIPAATSRLTLIPNSIAGRTKRLRGPHAARVFETPGLLYEDT